MKKFVAAASLWAGALLIASPSHAEDEQGPTRWVVLDWRINEVFVDNGTVEIDKKSDVTIASARPSKLFVTSDVAKRGRFESDIPAGSIFAQNIYSDQVVCEPALRRKQSTIACLADFDDDGAFDHEGHIQTTIFGALSSTKIGFLVGRFNVDEWDRLEKPVFIEPVAEAPESATMEIKLELFSIKGAWGRKGPIFRVCADQVVGKTWGGGKHIMSFCLDDIEYPNPEARSSHGLIGDGRFRLLSTEKKSVTVLIDPPTNGSPL